MRRRHGPLLSTGMGSVTVDVVAPAPTWAAGGSRTDHRPLLVGAMAMALCLVVMVATWPMRPYPLSAWVPLELTGLVIVACGAATWRRSPSNRTGPLLVLVGVTWYIANLQLLPSPWAFAVGFCLFGTDMAVLGHLLLALPDGRLRGRGARILVVLLYAAGPGTQVPRYFDETVVAPQVWGDPRLSDSVWADTGSLAIGLLTIVVLTTVGLQWRRSGRPLRRRYSAVLVTLGATGCATLVSTLSAQQDLSEPWRRSALVAVAAGITLTPLALGVGLLRLRLQRLRVADLVVDLSRNEHPQAVRDALAKALDDATLEVLYWLPEQEHYVDGEGRPERSATPQTGDRASTVVETRGRPLAKLVHDPALADQRSVVAPVVAAARLALENAHLEATARAQLNELRASRARLVTAADSERRRIQRDLHDGAQHQLLALSMMLGQAEHDNRSPSLTLARAQLGELIRELRDLTQGILPPVLEEQGLAAALVVLAERSPVPVRVVVPGRRWPGELERTVWFVVTEALANVYKHAGATCASVEVGERGEVLWLEVVDDGCGGAAPHLGSGLQGIGDRVQSAGGEFRVTSEPGRGTTVRVDLPCG